VKFIRKGRKPAALSKFERENVTTPQTFKFDALPTRVKCVLCERMLAEQGRLCAYTMRRIGEEGAVASDFHLEHIRSQSGNPELQLDYANLVLCAPRGDRPCEWGAINKKNVEVNVSNFVSPLRQDCEERLLYRSNGLVNEYAESDEAARSTINLLNLNHRELVLQRTAALREFGLAEGARKPLSAKALERLSRQICEPSGSGDFAPFCIAVRHVATHLANKAVQRALRLRIER
jgi:uncharacterized protein (TIGR02646 family)